MTVSEQGPVLGGGGGTGGCSLTSNQTRGKGEIPPQWPLSSITTGSAK